MNLELFTDNGHFLMLALDHRGSFRKAINPENPDNVTDAQAIEVKKNIIGALYNLFSGTLIDPQYGLPALEQVAETAQTKKPFLLPMEKTGYQDDGGERVTELEYPATELITQGAAGAKLLLYFNPFAANARQQIATAQSALDDAHAHDLPFFLEIVTYEVEGHDASQSDLIVTSVEQCMQEDLKPDVFKLAYPGSEQACRQVHELVDGIPWILLTAGKSFETFEEQMKTATDSGAQGFLAGRALWQEVFELDGEELQVFLKQTLPERFGKISQVWG